MYNVYKQHWTNLKFLKEKNLGLTASLTEKVFTATNQKKDMERRDRVKVSGYSKQQQTEENQKQRHRHSVGSRWQPAA